MKMKNLRLLILMLLGFAMITSCTNYKNTILSIEDDVVELKVSLKTTSQELEEISKKLLAEKNITLDYSKTKFNRNGRINDLHLKVKCYKKLFRNLWCIKSFIKGSRILWIYQRL